MKMKLMILSVLLSFSCGCNKLKTNNTDKYTLNSGEVFDENGNKIESTIDGKIQHFVDSVLREGVTFHNAESGCVIVMETGTGEVKSMVNLIKTNDNQFTTDSNLAMNHYYEFGSLFKLYSAMVLIEDGLIKADDSVFVDNGSAMIGGIRINDVHRSPYLKMTFKDAFANSSNVVFSRLVYENYKNNPVRFLSYCDVLNFNIPLPVDILGYNSPEKKEPGTSEWNDSTLQYLSLGYGIRLSPIQLLTFYNSISNNGEMVIPYFVSESKGKIKSNQVCKAETAKSLQNFLVSTVKYGTAINLRNEKIQVAGKTGTSILLKNGYETYLASFVGYFPVHEPKYTCFVMIMNPRNGIYYGASVAGPVFREIAAYLE